MAKLDDVNPHGLMGYRNLECPHYLSCLDQAVHLSWQTFNCQLCSHQRRKQPLHAEDVNLKSDGWVELWSQAGWEG
jgi:hypothetical protein